MSEVKQEYGGALYLLCEEEQLSSDCLAQLHLLRRLMGENPDYYRLMAAPTVTVAQKLAALDEAFHASVHPYVLNFLKILAENGYFSEFGACCDEFENRYNADRNICVAKVTTAVALTDEQKQRLQKKLELEVGKTVQMHCLVDPSVMGGVRAELDGLLLDSTVKNKIDSIRDNLRKTVI